MTIVLIVHLITCNMAHLIAKTTESDKYFLGTITKHASVLTSLKWNTQKYTV